MKSIFKLLIAICTLLLVACNRDSEAVDSTTSDSAVSTPLRFSLEPEDAFTLSSASDTRATTETVVENDLQNVWVLLFDEDSVRIEPTAEQLYYIDDSGEQQQRQGITADDEVYGSTYIDNYTSKQTIFVNKELSAKIRHIRAVANTSATWAYFTADSCATLTQYDDIHFSLTNNAYRESDMWNEFNGICYLRMAGNWDGEIPETGLDFNIAVLAKPLAAKVTVAYECFDESVTDGSGRSPSTIDVTSVQITRVPKNCYYKDVEDDPESHVHTDFTSYQPRYVYDQNYLSTKEGEVSFYVPQNMRGIAGSSDPNVTEEEARTLSSESLKTLYHAQDATCVIITGLYKYWDETLSSMEKKYVYIQLYPGENNYDDYNVKLRHEYHMTCTITADADTVKWNTDYRVTLSEVLPEGAIVHYEFDPDNLTLNSAYDKYRQPLGGYPQTVGVDAGYLEYSDNVRNSDNLTIEERTKNSYYYTHDENGVAYSYDNPDLYDLDIEGLDDYYDRFIYGFPNTTNAFATEVSKPFLRNLASPNDKYDNEDNIYPDYPKKSHPEIFDCTHIKDNYDRYTSVSNYTSGELNYYYPNSYINSSYLQLSTNWGTGINPHNGEFTIVFIGSLGVNKAMTNERGVFYGNSLEWNKRWYFYRNVESGSIGNITYGFGEYQTVAIDALYADAYDNVQSYDICDNGWRKVFYNNVDVEAKQADLTVPTYNATTTYVTDRPSTSEFVFDAPISIFGHTSDDNKDDAIDGKLRLFLIYDRVLDLDEIDQIRRYAALKGLLLYGEADYEGFNVKVIPSLEPAWDTEVEWNNGGSSDVTFGTAPSN